MGCVPNLIPNLMRFLNSFLSAISIVLATAPYAFAHYDPAPQGILLTLAVVVLIMVLTLAGGGSGVLARLQAAKYPSKVRRTLANILKFIAGVVLFFLSIMIVPFFGLAGFSIYAIVRGVKMIKWSMDAEKVGARPAHLEGVVAALDHVKRRQLANLLESRFQEVGPAEGITRSGDEEHRYRNARKVILAQAIGLPGRMERISKEDEPRARVALGCEIGRHAAAHGLAA